MLAPGIGTPLESVTVPATERRSWAKVKAPPSKKRNGQQPQNCQSYGVFAFAANIRSRGKNRYRNNCKIYLRRHYRKRNLTTRMASATTNPTTLRCSRFRTTLDQRKVDAPAPAF